MKTKKDILYALECLAFVFLLVPAFMVSVWIILEHITK